MEQPTPCSTGNFEKLSLLKSPLSNDLAARNELSTGFQQAIGAQGIRELGYEKDLNPTLLRNSQAGNLETFYDLFLAACISLFNQNQQVNASEALSNYIGFFSLIWSTWLVTSLYDVRFVTDSVFERCARAVHMGVLVGFVTTSPNFDTSNQDAVIFQTFSIILMASRLCIALQYGVIMWHTRKYKATFLPLGIMVGLNIIAAIIYLGVSFRFHASGSSRIFSVWYCVAVVEIIVSMGLSVYYQVLSFQGTHLISRVSLLTCIIFGEAVAQACGKITNIVKVGSHAEWTSRTIGVVAAGVAISYIIFMIYFDWMPTWDLSNWRQLTWCLLHYGLHLTMTMFVEGVSQFVLYWKCVENGTEWVTKMSARLESEETGTGPAGLAEFLAKEIISFTQQWKITYSHSEFVLRESIERLNATSEEDLTDPESIVQFNSYVATIFVSLQNVLYGRYGVDFIPDVEKAFNTTEMINKYEAIDDDYIKFRDIEYDHQSRVLERFKIVFMYTFVCGGLFLAISSMLYVISRRKRWSLWALIRVTINFILSLGICLIAIIGNTAATKVSADIADQLSDEDSEVYATTTYNDFADSPAVLPTLVAAYFVVLLANHITGDGPRFSFFQTFKSRMRPEDAPTNHQQQDSNSQVQLQSLQATTKYDQSSHVMSDTQQPFASPAPYGQPQYQPLTTQPLTTVYQYSGENGSRVQSF